MLNTIKDNKHNSSSFILEFGKVSIYFIWLFGLDRVIQRPSQKQKLLYKKQCYFTIHYFAQWTHTLNNTLASDRICSMWSQPSILLAYINSLIYFNFVYIRYCFVDILVKVRFSIFRILYFTATSKGKWIN